MSTGGLPGLWRAATPTRRTDSLKGSNGMVDASALFLKGCPTFAMSMASFRNFDLRKVRQT